MFSKAGQKGLVLQRRVPCEKAPSASQPESISVFTSLVFLALIKSVSAVVRARTSAALWGSVLLQIGCTALRRTGGNFLLPELVATPRMVFLTSVGKTVLALLSLASKSSFQGEQERIK